MNSNVSDNNIIFDLSEFPKGADFLNKVLSNKYSFITSGGAIRGGKTFNALGSLVLLHLKYPYSRSVIVRKTLETLRRNTLPACEKVIPKNFVKKYNGSSFEWTFENNSQMIFFAEGYDIDKEYDRWKGLEYNFILLEQLEELQESTLHKAMERVGTYIVPKKFEQPNPLILATTNPTQNWVKDKIYKKWIDNELPKRWGYVPAKITDNPHNPASLFESLLILKEINPIKYQRYVEGDWDVQEMIEGAFWKMFKFEKHTELLKLNIDEPLHISFDENVNPYPALSIWQINDREMIDDFGEKQIKGKQIKQIHEICLKHPQNKLKEVAKEFIRWTRANGWQNVVYIYGDASSDREDTKMVAGFNYFSMLRNEIEKEYRCVIRKPSKNPAVAMSAEFINSIYENNFDNLEIIINETCKESIKDYIFAQEGADGSMIKKKTKGIELIGHLSDTKRYFICQAFRSSFERYQRGIREFTYTLGKKKEISY